eukprot:353301-Chlamydomonas_euryale.AAC.1
MQAVVRQRARNVQGALPDGEAKPGQDRLCDQARASDRDGGPSFGVLVFRVRCIVSRVRVLVFRVRCTVSRVGPICSGSAVQCPGLGPCIQGPFYIVQG